MPVEGLSPKGITPNPGHFVLMLHAVWSLDSGSFHFNEENIATLCGLRQMLETT